MNLLWTRTVIAGCGLAMVLTGAACNRHDAVDVDRDNDRLAADTATAPGHEGAPITITGCLQRGSGMNNYVLTQVDSPSDTPVATSGNDASGAAVQREQMREAKHSYVLDDNDKDAMRDLVGKQIRVNGTIDEASNLHSDLAKIKVQGIVQVAEECGQAK